MNSIPEGDAWKDPEATYGQLVSLIQESDRVGMTPNCVIARSEEDAYALAQWIEDNGLA